jgi:hypothetical protein
MDDMEYKKRWPVRLPKSAFLTVDPLDDKYFLIELNMLYFRHLNFLKKPNKQ